MQRDPADDDRDDRRRAETPPPSPDDAIGVSCDVRRVRVGEQHRPDLGRLPQPALEAVGAVRLQVALVVEDVVASPSRTSSLSIRCTISTRLAWSSSTFCAL